MLYTYRFRNPMLKQKMLMLKYPFGPQWLVEYPLPYSTNKILTLSQLVFFRRAYLQHFNLKIKNIQIQKYCIFEVLDIENKNEDLKAVKETMKFLLSSGDIFID